MKKPIIFAVLLSLLSLGMIEKTISNEKTIELNINEEFDLSMICRCGVCDELLLPDDEAYTDEITGKVLCDKHSITNPETGNYIESD